MATRRPLVNLSGQLAELPVGDTLAGAGSGGGVTVSDTAPSSPTNGQEWTDTNTGIKYTWIVDGDGAQWVELGPNGQAAIGFRASGTATLDFGAFPGSQEASISVTAQTGIQTTDLPRAWVSADDSVAGHSANDHKYLPLFVQLSAGTPTAAVGFTIHARSTHRMQGQFKVRWAW